MAPSTIFACIQIGHGYLDVTLFHLGKYVRIVAVGTSQSSVFVGGSVKYYRAHRAALELQVFTRPYGNCIPANHNR